ncbi:MAG: phage baseplate assembly protein V [[Actinobacillus] rossii]|nr:phage baseplate assembly protein V [[Actinobacillus] rossii]
MRRLSQQISQAAQNIAQGIRQAFRGTLNLMNSKDDIQKTQVSGLSGEIISDLEFMQQFGFTSVPPANTQAVIIPIGGATSHGVVIATENGEFRIKNLKGGEVAVYNQSGASIVLKQGKIIEVDCEEFNVKANTKVSFLTPEIKASGSINADGDMNTKGAVKAKGDVSAGDKSLTNHTHREQGDGALTSSPL